MQESIHLKIQPFPTPTHKIPTKVVPNAQVLQLGELAEGLHTSSELIGSNIAADGLSVEKGVVCAN